MYWIYRNVDTNCYIFCTQQELYRLDNNGLKPLTFKQFVREIDIKVDIEPKVKENIIMFMARHLQMVS